MKSLIHLCLVGSILICAANAQDPSKPVLRQGVSVQMAVATHPVMLRAADELNAVVVAITANGELYLGAERTSAAGLAHLTADTIYVKADSRAPFQTVLTVLDALRGKSVGLLTATPTNTSHTPIAPPYGLKLDVAK
jgi:hypothetical protein